MGEKERKKLWVLQHFGVETLWVYGKHQPVRLLYQGGLYGKVIFVGGLIIQFI